MQELERSSRREVSDAALKQNVLYTAAALEIATGPVPTVNLLDMIVFIRLSKEIFETHWKPRIFGKDGEEALAAFQKSDEELLPIAEPCLTAHQLQELGDLIREWRRENPAQIRVEGIRLDDFASLTGQGARARRSGFLASVKIATQVADEALLVAERVMFLVHRMPFLLRLQVRLASREIAGDLTAGPGSPLASTLRAVFGLVRRCVPYVVLTGAAWSASWWLGSRVSRQRLARAASPRARVFRRSALR